MNPVRNSERKMKDTFLTTIGVIRLIGIVQRTMVFAFYF